MKPAVIEVAETVHENGMAPRDTGAVVVRQHQEIGRALSLNELTDRLRFVKQVMQEVMAEGTDYGKVPGCGEKPCLLQPGAQKLGLTFQLRDHVTKEVIKEFQNFHREYEVTIEVRPPGTQQGDGWDGVGTCSTLESKYRYRDGSRKCPKCGGAFIIKGKEQYGGGWLCFSKKGGCGEKYADNSELGKQIAAQSAGKVEHDNPPDYWNTVRKMAFKRALVHAMINATNTSDLWTQDIDETERDHDDPGAGGGSSPARAANTRPTARTVNTSPQANPVPPREAPQPKTETKAKEVRPKAANDLMKARFLAFVVSELSEIKEEPTKADEYLWKLGWLLPDEETLSDLQLRYVPVTGQQTACFMSALIDFINGNDAVQPYPPNDDTEPPKKEAKQAGEVAASGDESWRSFLMPFGKDKGTPLGELNVKTAIGWFLNYKVETHYNGKEKKAETIAKDQAFRDALDAMGKSRNIEKKDGQ